MAVRTRALSMFLVTGHLFVAGCVAPHAIETPPARPGAEAALARLEGFDFEGRAAIRQADKGTQASIDWQQHGADSRLRLSGPFGAGAVRVALEADVLSIEDSRGTRLKGPEAEAALAELLGFAPPLAMLRWWLLALPAPDFPAEATRDDAGRLASLLQSGWHVEYQEYRDEPLAGATVAMPRRLRATREALDLRLVIDRWTLAP